MVDVRPRDQRWRYHALVSGSRVGPALDRQVLASRRSQMEASAVTRTSKFTGRQCQVVGVLLSAATFRGEQEHGRCDQPEGHPGHHSCQGACIKPDQQVELTDAQWRALDSLMRGDGVVLHVHTRKFLVREGYVEMTGPWQLKRSAKITDLGRKIFPTAIRRSAW